MFFSFCVPSIKPQTTISMVLIDRVVSCRSYLSPTFCFLWGLHVARNNPVPLVSHCCPMAVLQDVLWRLKACLARAVRGMWHTQEWPVRSLKSMVCSCCWRNGNWSLGGWLCWIVHYFLKWCFNIVWRRCLGRYCLLPALASWSASSLPFIPQCEETHWTAIVLFWQKRWNVSFLSVFWGDISLWIMDLLSVRKMMWFELESVVLTTLADS
jgi:hypothetical protein